MKTRNMAICLFFAFGCWLKDIRTELTQVSYDIWLVLAVFWAVVNFIALCDTLTKNKKDDMAKHLTNEMAIHWFFLTILSLISFLLAREYMVVLLMMCSAVPFMAIQLYKKEKTRKK